MVVHLDGARIANAAASLDVPLRAFTTDVGVDVVSFGGTKNGLMLGECVVVLNPAAVRGMDFLRKSAMQLASKMRFVSAQFDALLSGDLWLRNAGHANAMARRLEAAVRDIPGVALQRPVQANSVFVDPPAGGHRATAEAVPLLRLGRADRGGALDDLLRHHRAGHRRLRGGHRRRDGPGLTNSALRSTGARLSAQEGRAPSVCRATVSPSSCCI